MAQYIKKYNEFVNEYNNKLDIKNYYILYHSTDSDFFDVFNHENATKGDKYFNPLGNGLYCSTNKDFTKRFGKNTYYYILPKNCKIKTITQKNWMDDYMVILKKILKEYGIDFHKSRSLTSTQQLELVRLSKNTPIESMNNLYELLSGDDLGYNLKNVMSTIESVVDKINSKYDAVWYKATDYYQTADEVLIPTKSFNKNYFFKEFPIYDNI